MNREINDESMSILSDYPFFTFPISRRGVATRRPSGNRAINYNAIISRNIRWWPIDIVENDSSLKEIEGSGREGKRVWIELAWTRDKFPKLPNDSSLFLAGLQRRARATSFSICVINNDLLRPFRLTRWWFMDTEIVLKLRQADYLANNFLLQI